MLPIAHPKPGERWLLVTSGYHMPRAVGAFRKVGFEVEAYPVDYRTRGIEDIWIPFDDVASGLRRTDTASREWIGMFVYWLTGKSSAIFPAPMTERVGWAKALFARRAHVERMNVHARTSPRFAYLRSC